MKPARMAARLFARLLHAAGVAALGVLAVLAIVIAALGLRLARGPLDVAWAVRAGLSLAAGAGHVRIGAATLSWAGWHDGAGSPVRLVVHRLAVTAPDGTTRLSAAEGTATLSAAGLLKGEVVPATAELTGVRLRATRDPAGTWHLLGEDEAPDTASDAASGMGSTLDQLRRVSLHDATVDVEDARLGPWQLAGVDADLTRDESGGIQGEAAAYATLGGLSTHVAVHAVVQPGGTSRVEFSTGPVDPAALAEVGGPALAAANVLDAPLSLTGALELDKDARPVSAAVSATSGPGWLNLFGGAIRFDSLAASTRAEWVDGLIGRVPEARVEAAVPSPTGPDGTAPVSHVVLTAQATRSGNRLAATVVADVDQVAFADLPNLWPPAASRNARAWVTENITAGTARDAHLSIGLAGSSDLSDVDVTDVSARIRGEDATVWWLRPAPPVEHVGATFTLSDRDTIDIVLNPAPGQQTLTTSAGKLTVGAGSIRLTGLADHDQTATIDLDITGTVPATVALLSHSRLRLLSRHPPPFGSTSGDAAVHFNIRVPLKREVGFDDIPVEVDARLTRLRLAGLIAHRDLTDGDLLLHVTQDGLDLSGRAAVAGMPGALRAGLDFRAGPPTQLLQSASFDARPTAAQLQRAGAPVDDLLTGAPAVKVTYASHRDGAGEVSANADLTGAGVDALGWRKAEGVPARVQAHIVLDHDRLAAVDVLRAEGPGLSVHGRAEFAGPGRPPALVVDGAEIGRTRLNGRVQFGPTLTVSANGPVLDIGSLLEKDGSGRSKGTGGDRKPGTPFVADAAFGEVLLGPGRRLTGVTAHADSDGATLRRASLNSTGPERLAATLVPDGRGRLLNAQAADGGALLRALDLSDRFETGEIKLDARFDDTLPDSPLTGTLATGRLHVLGAPVAGKVLQALTIYGIADALRGPGLVFSRLEVPFLFADRRLDLRDVRLLSASLGITASGAIDLGRRMVDVTGTVVPAYAVNAAPGRIPVIGPFLTAGKDGGLFAAAYRVSGPLDDPNVSVNPLTLLAPGRLRRLFGAQD